MDISVDFGTILPIIYSQIVDGFDEALAEMDENICVLSMWGLFVFVHFDESRFDPTGSLKNYTTLSSRLGYEETAQKL